jgi:hypothetical protein
MREDCLVLWYPATKILMQRTFMKFVPSSVSMVRGGQTTACRTRGWLFVEGLAERLRRRCGREGGGGGKGGEGESCYSFATWMS